MYLYGIEIIINGLSIQAIKSSNCTFMELKCQYLIDRSHRLTVLIVPLWNWNYTMIAYESTANGVLIVPLWNWNQVKQGGKGTQGGSNCTFMELKFNNVATGQERGLF